MKVLFSGFNGFHQLSVLMSNYVDISPQNDIIKSFVVHDQDCELTFICSSWSNILIGSNKDLRLSGFVNGKPAQCVSLDNPFKEQVCQASICKEIIVMVTKNGEVWQFNIHTSEWKNLSYLFRTEVSDKEPGRILKVCKGETLSVALSITGIGYCIPNRLNYNGVIKDIACGKEHGIILTEDGSVFTWGGGSRGQLGIGDLESCETLCEVEALSGMGVVTIAAGGWHSAAITSEGDLYTWGWNKQGQLGFPTAEKKDGVSVLAIPQPLELPEDMFVEEVSCGASHTVIKLRNGDVLGCGWNKWGQLGLGNIQHCSEMTKLLVPPELSVNGIICDTWSTFLLC